MHRGRLSFCRLLGAIMTLLGYSPVVLAEDKPQIHPVTASPSGKFHLWSESIYQLMPGDATPLHMSTVRVVLLDREGQVKSACVVTNDSPYIFEKGRFQARVFWNEGESAVAINAHGRLWGDVDVYSVRDGQIVPFPVVNYFAITRARIKNCTVVNRSFINFKTWLSPDTFEVSYSGYAYIGPEPEPQPWGDLTDPALYQDFSYKVKVQISFKEVRILEVTDAAAP